MKIPNPVSFACRAGFCLALLTCGGAARAAEDELRVDVVVDATDAGEKLAPPTPDHPVYYYPVTKGYVTGGQPLADQAPPPPTIAVQRLLAKALYAQGYRVMNREHPATLILMLWWGYLAPIVMEGGGSAAAGFDQGSSQMRGMGGSFGSNQQGAGAVMGLAVHGMLPANVEENNNQMQELVLGSKFEPDSLQNHPSLRLETAVEAARRARYYLMVSALDFKEANEHKKFVVYWTARVSTDLEGNTLDGVLPALIESGAPHFGRDTDGPLIMGAKPVPLGHVEMGTPVLKTDHPEKPQKTP